MMTLLKLSLPFSAKARMTIRLVIGLTTGLVGVADMLSAVVPKLNWDIPFVVMSLLVLIATRGRISYGRYQSQVVLLATEAVVEQEPETVDSSA